FYYVAKYLSFSKAASKLYISQSAVSQNIKSLEKELNTKLFIRSTKNVSLSKSGSLLLEHIEPAFNLIKSGEKNIREINALQRGELHIGANDTISKDFLLPYLKKFHKLYPDIHLLITNRTSSTCIDLLKQNTVDLIISNLPNDKVTASMKVKQIYSFNDIFISGKEYKELNRKTISLKKLSSYPLLMLEEKTTTRKFLEKYLNKYGIEIEAKIELGSVDLLIEMAKIGLGIAYVPDYSLDLKKEGLFRLDIKEKIAKRNLAVIRNKNIPLTNAAEKFIELF
ncbi:MAG: LysR substrate-binding domain-containing protein, partial [Bacillota bacterium]